MDFHQSNLKFCFPLAVMSGLISSLRSPGLFPMSIAVRKARRVTFSIFLLNRNQAVQKFIIRRVRCQALLVNERDG